MCNASVYLQLSKPLVKIIQDGLLGIVLAFLAFDYSLVCVMCTKIKSKILEEEEPDLLLFLPRPCPPENFLFWPDHRARESEDERLSGEAESS
jgi:hypothetical protein